jgi:hypothetical protein
VIEVLEPVQIVQVPGDRGVLAVDFEGVQGLVAAGVPRGLERGQRAVAEPGQERAGVVDPHLLDLAGERVFAFLMKVSVMALTVRDAAVQPDGRVDAVGQQIAR